MSKPSGRDARAISDFPGADAVDPVFAQLIEEALLPQEMRPDPAEISGNYNASAHVALLSSHAASFGTRTDRQAPQGGLDPVVALDEADVIDLALAELIEEALIRQEAQRLGSTPPCGSTDQLARAARFLR